MPGRSRLQRFALRRKRSRPRLDRHGRMKKRHDLEWLAPPSTATRATELCLSQLRQRRKRCSQPPVRDSVQPVERPLSSLAASRVEPRWSAT